jgi:hypothetical protein
MSLKNPITPPGIDPGSFEIKQLTFRPETLIVSQSKARYFPEMYAPN